jgi:hypothetical protein
MTPAEAREQLAVDLELTADWRRRNACQDPDEPRNAEAAALLARGRGRLQPPQAKPIIHPKIGDSAGKAGRPSG